jgi:hypothetical protein
MRDRGAQYRTTVRLLRAVKRQIREVQGPDDAEVAAYYRAYKEELQRARATRSSLSEVLKAASRSPCVLVGDFHALEQAQKLFVDLLENLGRSKIRPILVLEMAHANKDAALYHYLRGSLKEPEFLEEIRYFETWGFDFSHYKPIFDHARRWRLAVHGLNKEGPLHARDRFMALRLSHLHERYPGQPLLVLVGDLHIASDHLPRELESAGMRPVVVYQNSESVYLKKLKAGQDPVGWWRLGPGRFLNINTAPQVKMQSYLTWLEHGQEALCQAYGYTAQCEREGEIELSESVSKAAAVLCDLFGYNGGPPADFQVFEGASLSFLDDDYFKKGPGKKYADLVRDARSVFVLSKRLLYVPRLDLNRTIEETTHLLMNQWLPTGRGLQSFLARLHYFASGFLGSKIVNPTRPARSAREAARFLESYRKMPDGKDKGKLAREAKVNEWVLAFLHILHRDEPVSRGAMAPILRADAELIFDVSRTVGYSLGQRLYELYDAGQLSASDLKRYVFEQDDPFYLLGARLRIAR